jgi:hypothetical protein
MMKRTALVSLIACLYSLVVGIGVALGQQTGSVVGWGSMVVVEQADLDSLIAVAGGGSHSLGLKSDGTVVAWGRNYSGQCDVPAPNADFIAVAAGSSHSLGIKSSTVTAIEDNGPGDAPGASSLEIRTVIPNPFNPSTEITFESLGSCSITMEIYDVSGRRVGMESLGSFEPGVHRARWDGCNTQGKPVSSGVYFIRMCSDDIVSLPVKAILLR